MEAKFFVIFCTTLFLSIKCEPLTECQPGVMFIADLEDLCSYHWCVGPDNTAIKWRCPPGARVPTWFETAPNESEVPCTLDHSQDVTCLRCDYGPDKIPDPVVDSCKPNPCAAECECQNLHADEFHCICPGDVVPSFVADDSRAVDYCQPDRCVNGGICFSQWDTYWCQCPNGYTGKNCEVPFCEPNPCMNGGTCIMDDHNYRCECLPCFAGACCNVTLASCRPVLQCDDPCKYGDTCQLTREDSCNCNPCPDEEDDCRNGRTREIPRECSPPENPPTTTEPPNICDVEPERLCECNPCESEGQICTDGEEGQVRQCLGRPGPYGTTYTLTFSDDAGTGSTYRRVYISSTGARLNSNSFNRVRIYTPGISSGPCAVDLQVTVSFNDPFFFDVPDNCLNTDGEASNQILRVVELDGVQIVVTVTNMNGDGYLAIADEYAGQHYVAHTLSSSGAFQYITVVALQDNTEVTIRTPLGESFALEEGAGFSSNLFTFTLNALSSFRFQISGALESSMIVSNRDIHVWSGNNDAASQKTQEMLMSVNRWGASAESHDYVISSASSSELNLADIVYMETSGYITYQLQLVTASGVQNIVTGEANGYVRLGQLRAGEMFYLSTSEPVQVTHNIRGANSDSVNFYSAYALIPSIQSYASSYSFQVHGEREGVGSEYTNHILTIISPRNVIADAPSSIEAILIYRFNPATGLTERYSVEDLGGRFVRVFDFFHSARLELPGPGVYYLSNPSLQAWKFGAIYYGVTRLVGGSRSLQPNTAFPLGVDVSMLNDFPKPTLCGGCRRGPDCDVVVINTCACNPCSSFDDSCSDNPNPELARTCTPNDDSTGQPFHLMFMQNRPDNTDKRELEIYITSAGRTKRNVRVFTPFTPTTDECYLDIEREIPGLTVSQFNLPNPGCYETIESGVFQNKIIKVTEEDNKDLLVYAVNRDEWSADGWVALPDSGAGLDYYVVAHAPPRYGTQFAVLAMVDTRVTLTYTGEAEPSTGFDRTVFDMTAGEVLQIQSDDDLSGTRVQADQPVNVYSGNIRALVVRVEDPSVGNINSGSRDHLIEQLVPTSRWGLVFNVEPVPGRRFGDQLKVVASIDNTNVVLARRDPQGDITQQTFILNSGEFLTTDVVSSNTYRVTSNNKIFVAQIVKSAERGSFHDPSLLTVPPVEQYSNRYVFSTPEFSGGNGQKRPYNTTLVLISARSMEKDNIFIYNTQTDGVRVSDLASSENPWRPVPGSDYENIAVEINYSTNLIVHPDSAVAFMCLFYGFDDRESLGFPIGMKLQKL